MKKTPLLLLGIALVLALVWTAIRNSQTLEVQHITGMTMGAIVYNVKYIGEQKDLKEEIDNELVAFNQSLSTYIPNSEISTLNKKGKITYESEYFYPVLAQSQVFYEKTGGAYDPTVGPLVRAWGFGPEERNAKMDSATVDSLMSIKGFNHVTFDADNVQIPTNFQLDFSAIAKGYAVDIVAMILENHGFTNYMVEIGGEVRCSGVNDKEESWSLGVEDPTVDSNEQKLLAIVRLRNKSLATSGNYRNYYKEGDRIFAHILDPRTGYTNQHNLLSASVFAEDCMSADAYATAMMVLGLDASIKLVETIDGLDAYLIYQDENGELRSHASEGIRPYLTLDRTKKQ